MPRHVTYFHHGVMGLYFASYCVLGPNSSRNNGALKSYLLRDLCGLCLEVCLVLLDGVLLLQVNQIRLHTQHTQPHSRIKSLIAYNKIFKKTQVALATHTTHGYTATSITHTDGWMYVCISTATEGGPGYMCILLSRCPCAHVPGTALVRPLSRPCAP